MLPRATPLWRRPPLRLARPFVPEAREASPSLGTLLILGTLFLFHGVFLHLSAVEVEVDRLVPRMPRARLATAALESLLNITTAFGGWASVSTGHWSGIECDSSPDGACFLNVTTFCPAPQRPTQFWYLAPAWLKAQALLELRLDLQKDYLAAFYGYTAGSCYWREANALYVRIYKAGNDFICGNLDEKARGGNFPFGECRSVPNQRVVS